jgi:hypothetical protein
MTYCSIGTLDKKEASCIYTGLPVEESSGDLGMGYWPAYSEMKPHQRRYYLRWLASGKKEPIANIGYAFVYFYGLERRALLDGQDLPWIMEEAIRLLGLYGSSRSFQRYLCRFLLYLYAKNLEDPRMTSEKIADLYRCLPASPRTQDSTLFRIVLGYRALKRTPLSPEQAFNILRRLLPQRDAAEASQPGLKKLFALRYRQAYPEGLVLSSSPRKKYSVAYSVASGTLSFPRGSKSPEPAGIPDVLGKKSQFKKLREIRETCLEELLPRSSGGRDLNGNEELVVMRMRGKKEPEEPSCARGFLPSIRVDMDKVALLKEETEILARELAVLFESEELPDSDPARGKNAPRQALEPKPDFSSLPFEEEAVRELDRKYWPCAAALLGRRQWSQEEFAALARRHGVMPNALFQELNAWSADTFGDFLLLEDARLHLKDVHPTNDRGWLLNEDVLSALGAARPGKVEFL